MRSLLRCFSARCVVVAAVMIGAVAAPGRAANAPASELLDRTAAALFARQLPEAIALARRAVQAYPDNLDAHASLALAYAVARQFDAADEAIAIVLTIPAIGRGAVANSIVDRVKNLRVSDRLAREAGAAAADGLAAKAAKLYAEAFALSFYEVELGLKCAELQAYRLNQPLLACAMWRDVRSAALEHGYKEAAARAEAGLREFAGQMRLIAEEGLRDAKRESDPKEREMTLKIVEGADPDYAELHLYRAQLAASGDLRDPAPLLAALRALAKRDLASPWHIAALPNMVNWWLAEGDKGEAVSGLVTDIVGLTQRVGIQAGDYGDDRGPRGAAGESAEVVRPGERAPAPPQGVPFE